MGLALTSSLVALPASVEAGDSPKDVPFSWTGFYAGLNAGYSWSDSNSISTSASTVELCSPAPPGSCGFLPAASAAAAAGASGVWPVNTDGFIAGGQAGYNFQISNKLVAGVEADIQMMPGSDRASATTVTPGPFPGGPVSNISTDLSVTKAIDYLGTLRGRLGYLVTPAVLVYGTGGFAYGGVKSSTTISQAYAPVVFNSIEPQWSSFASNSDTITGWTAGGAQNGRLGPM